MLRYQISADTDAAQRKQEGVLSVDFGQCALLVEPEGVTPSCKSLFVVCSDFAALVLRGTSSQRGEAALNL